MFGANRDQDRVFQWWKIAALTKFQLLLEVAGKIVVPRKLNGRRKRSVSLNEDFPVGFAASGASGYLRQKLERSLARAKIGKMQRQIGVNDPNQSDVGKMQTFCNHLRADQDIDFSGPKTSERFAISFLARHRIGIHSAHVRFREKLRNG